MAMVLSEDHKRKMQEGRRRYLENRQARLARYEEKALQAQGAPPNGKTKQVPTPPPPRPRSATDFENMTLEELRAWTTETRKLWDQAIKWLQQKEAVYATEHTSVPCACGCGQLVDLSRGRFASSEAYRDSNFQIQVRYWATQRCVSAFRLANSPAYKEQLRKELEEKLTEKQLVTAKDVLE